jgi:hypothetical protein
LISDRKRALRRRDPRAPHQRIEPGSQLAERERLGQIVVAAGPQAADPLVDVAERAQDQDRRLVAGLAQRRDDAEPVDAAGQHAVEHDRVIGLAAGEQQPVPAVVGMVDRVAGLEQALADELRDPLVVFDQQDLHGNLADVGSSVGIKRGDRGHRTWPRSPARQAARSSSAR